MTNKALTQRTITMISAMPNWHLALYVEGENDGFELEPIIAWEIVREEGPMFDGRDGTWVHRTVWPITTGGTNDSNLWVRNVRDRNG